MKLISYGFRALIVLGLSYLAARYLGHYERLIANFAYATLTIITVAIMLDHRRTRTIRVFAGWALASGFTASNEAAWIVLKGEYGIEGVYLGLDTFSDWFEFGNYVRFLAGIIALAHFSGIIDWMYRMLYQWGLIEIEVDPISENKKTPSPK